MNQKGCALEFYSYLDAKNGFGATVRSNFKCTYDPKRETATAVKL